MAFNLHSLVVRSGRPDLRWRPIARDTSSARAPVRCSAFLAPGMICWDRCRICPPGSCSSGLPRLPRWSHVPPAVERGFQKRKSDQVTHPVTAGPSVPRARRMASELALDLGFGAFLDLIPASTSSLILHPEPHTPNPEVWSSPAPLVPPLKPDLDPGQLSPAP